MKILPAMNRSSLRKFAPSVLGFALLASLGVAGTAPAQAAPAGTGTLSVKVDMEHVNVPDFAITLKGSLECPSLTERKTFEATVDAGSTSKILNLNLPIPNGETCNVFIHQYTSKYGWDIRASHPETVTVDGQTFASYKVKTSRNNQLIVVNENATVEVAQLAEGVGSYALSEVLGKAGVIVYDRDNNDVTHTATSSDFNKIDFKKPGVYRVTVYATDAQGDHERRFFIHVRVKHEQGCGFVDVPQVNRYGGSSRIETSLQVWDRMCSDTVVLAGVTGIADAFTGGPLAAKFDTSVVYTDTNGVSQQLRTALQKHSVKKVIIVGGTGVVKPRVEADLRAMGITDITRYGGVNRYETAVRIAEFLDDDWFRTDRGGYQEMPVVLATGTDFADALAAAPFATKQGGGIILTAGDKFEKFSTAYLKNSIAARYTIGGAADRAYRTHPVAPDTDGAGTPINPLDGLVDSYVGSDRYDTAAKVAASFDAYHMCEGKHYMIVNGMQAADGAIAGGFASYKSNNGKTSCVTGAILYTTKSTLPAATAAQMERGAQLSLVGGFGVLDSNLEGILKQAVQK